MTSKPKRFLVLVEDAVVRENIGLTLQRAGYQTEPVVDTDGLLDRVQSSGCEAVIADIHLVSGDGNPVLRFLVTQHSYLKIVLLTEFSLLPDCLRAVDLGCDAFLPKPLNPVELLRVAHGIFSPQRSAVVNEAEVARVGIEDFIYGQGIPFSIFVRLKDGRFSKVAHVGRNIDFEAIEDFKARGLRELWLTRADFNLYVEMSQNRARKALTEKDLDELRCTRILRHACEVASENLRLMGATDQTIRSARETMETTIRYVATNSSVIAVLETIEQREPSAYTRAVTCGILCALIARVLGWVTESRIQALMLGGYLHDVGLNFLAFDLQTLRPDEMSTEQSRVFREHPRLGAEALAAVKGLPAELPQIVLQHHENCAGTGFPAQLPAHRIFPMAKIVHLVDEFCSALLALEPAARIEASKVLTNLVEENPAHFDEQAVLALKLLLSRPDPTWAAADFRSAVSRKGR